MAWAACLRFMCYDKIHDRAFIEHETFLLTIFTDNGSYHCYEVCSLSSHYSSLPRDRSPEDDPRTRHVSLDFTVDITAEPINASYSMDASVSIDPVLCIFRPVTNVLGPRGGPSQSPRSPGVLGRDWDRDRDILYHQAPLSSQSQPRSPPGESPSLVISELSSLERVTPQPRPLPPRPLQSDPMPTSPPGGMVERGRGEDSRPSRSYFYQPNSLAASTSPRVSVDVGSPLSDGGGLPPSTTTMFSAEVVLAQQMQIAELRQQVEDLKRIVLSLTQSGTHPSMSPLTSLPMKSPPTPPLSAGSNNVQSGPMVMPNGPPSAPSNSLPPRGAVSTRQQDPRESLVEVGSLLRQSFDSRGTKGTRGSSVRGSSSVDPRSSEGVSELASLVEQISRISETVSIVPDKSQGDKGGQVPHSAQVPPQIPPQESPKVSSVTAKTSSVKESPKKSLKESPLAKGGPTLSGPTSGNPLNRGDALELNGSVFVPPEITMPPVNTNHAPLDLEAPLMPYIRVTPDEAEHMETGLLPQGGTLGHLGLMGSLDHYIGGAGPGSDLFLGLEDSETITEEMPSVFYESESILAIESRYLR